MRFLVENFPNSETKVLPGGYAVCLHDEKIPGGYGLSQVAMGFLRDDEVGESVENYFVRVPVFPLDDSHRFVEKTDTI